MLIATLFLSLLFVFSFLLVLTSFSRKKAAGAAVSHLQSAAVLEKEVLICRKKKPKNKADLMGIFGTFDKNKDGYITKQELKESLKNIGMFMGESDVADMISRLDANGDGLIDFDEFCELFGSVMLTDQDQQIEGGDDFDGEIDLKEAFDVFDEDRDGLITVEELGLVLSSMGFKEGKRLEDCKEMIQRIDTDGDGMVNFDEFKRMMKGGEIGTLLPVS